MPPRERFVGLAVNGHISNRNISVCNLYHLHAFTPNMPNTICYSRIRGCSPPDLLHGFHVGQHASHYGVLEFRSPLTACGATADVDGVDGIPRGIRIPWQHNPESLHRIVIVDVGPFSPFPMRTKMRLKLLASEHPRRQVRTGLTPQGPAARDARLPCPRRSVSNLRRPTIKSM